MTKSNDEMTSLKLENEGLKDKIKSTLKEIATNEKLARVQDSVITNMRIDIRYCYMNSDNETKLKDIVKVN